jgi:hypothetical protein
MVSLNVMNIKNESFNHVTLCEFPMLSGFAIYFHNSFVNLQLYKSSGDFGVAYTAVNKRSDVCFVLRT